MMTRILQGAPLARKILTGLKKDSITRKLKLAVVQVGKNAVSQSYISEKAKAAEEIGMKFQVYRLPEKITEKALVTFIQGLGRDLKVTGLVVQLPLSKHLKTQEALNAIPLGKDVDVLSSHAFGLFALRQFPVLPPTVQAVSRLLKETRMQLKGRHAVVVGAGRLVGLPVSLWLQQQGVTVTLANKATKNLAAITKQADILVAATGKQGLITPLMVKKGAVVIDAGTSVEQGPSTGLRASSTKGDVDFKSVSRKASYISPVPGGVGPLTVACLLKNVVLLNKSKEFNATWH